MLKSRLGRSQRVRILRQNTAFIRRAPSRCHHLRRPAFHERSETVERLGEIVSDGGEAQAEMRGRVEAVAGS